MNQDSKTLRSFDTAHPTYDLPFCMHEAGGECHCRHCRLWVETHPAQEKITDNANVLWF